jgi:hypothetical protein
MKKSITVTHIDNCSHGYYSISKKDVERLGIVDKISGYSGLTFTRAYLEEDCDAALIHNAAKELGYELRIKDGYNENFKITHNYSPDLFRWTPELGDTVFVYKDKYELKQILKNHLIIVKDGMPYRVSKSNPFKFITSVEKKK